MTDYKRMITVIVDGDDIYEAIYMPEVPRKGDILALSSLTLGRSPVLEAIVSKVEWVRDQTQAYTSDLDGIYPRVTVRRTSRSVKFEREQREKRKASR